MSDMFDVVVIGAGIAGATVAANLGATHRVALVEAEEQAGYHTTGRSAAIWIRNYGPPDVRVLNGLSEDFYRHPPADIGTDHLAVGRKVVYLAPPEQAGALDTLISQKLGIEEISVSEVQAMVPALIAGYAVRAGLNPIPSTWMSRLCTSFTCAGRGRRAVSCSCETGRDGSSARALCGRWRPPAAWSFQPRWW